MKGNSILKTFVITLVLLLAFFDFYKWVPAEQQLDRGTLEEEYSEIDRRYDNTDENISGIKVDGYPIGIAINSETDRAYVINQRSATVSVIDTQNNRVIDTIDVEESPYAIDLIEDPLINTIYVVNLGAHSVSIIDGFTNKIIERKEFGDTGFPNDVRTDPATQLAYVTYHQKSNITVDYFLNEIQSLTNAYQASIQLPYEPYSVIYLEVDINEHNNAIYVECYCLDNAIITAINASTGEITGNIELNHSGAMAVNSITNEIYVVDSESRSIIVIDGTLNRVIHIIPLDTKPNNIAVNLETNMVFVTDYDGEAGGITVINGSTREKDHRIQLGQSTGNIDAIAIDMNENEIYVADPKYNSIYKIEGSTYNPLSGITFDISPPNTGKILCTIDDGQQRIEITSTIHREFPKNTRLNCEAIPYAPLLDPVLAGMMSLIGVDESTDNSRFYSWSENSGGSDATDMNGTSSRKIIMTNGFSNLTANFEILGPPLTPEAKMGTYIGLASASIPIVGGWLYKNWKKVNREIHRDRYYRTIEIIYSTLHENNPKECLKHLDQLRGQVINLLHDGKVTEEDYKGLNNRISKHEVELRRKIGEM